MNWLPLFLGLCLGTIACEGVRWLLTRRLSINLRKSAQSVDKPPPLRPAELRAALCVGEDEPWWQAVHAAIETQRESALAECHDIDNQKTPHLLHYYGGLAQGMVTLREFLEAERDKALKRGGDEED